MPVLKIDFFLQDVSFPLKNKKKIKSWLLELARAEIKNLAGVEVSVVLCSDDYLLSLNKQYLNKNTLTDIITFDYCEENFLRGDIFISIDRVAENAMKFKQATCNELWRIMAHGLLHLCGYADKTPAEKTKMTEKEDFYLILLRKYMEDDASEKKCHRK